MSAASQLLAVAKATRSDDVAAALDRALANHHRDHGGIRLEVVGMQVSKQRGVEFIVSGRGVA